MQIESETKMSGSKIVNAVLNVAEKASRIDLEQAGKKACETVKSLNAGTIVNAINVNSADNQLLWDLLLILSASYCLHL